MEKYMLRVIFLMCLLWGVSSVYAEELESPSQHLLGLLSSGIQSDTDRGVIRRALIEGPDLDAIVAARVVLDRPLEINLVTDELILAYSRLGEVEASLVLSVLERLDPSPERLLSIMRGRLDGDLLQRLRFFREIVQFPRYGVYFEEDIYRLIGETTDVVERSAHIKMLALSIKGNGSAIDTPKYVDLVLESIGASANEIEVSQLFECIGIVHPRLQVGSKIAVNGVLKKFMDGSSERLVMSAAREALSLGVDVDGAARRLIALLVSEDDVAKKYSLIALREFYADEAKLHAAISVIHGEDVANIIGLK